MRVGAVGAVDESLDVTRGIDDLEDEGGGLR